MADTPLPYRVERTRNRWSRATCTDDTIVIRLARGLSQAEEQEHIDNLLGRMSKAFVRMQSRSLVDPLRPLLHGGETAADVTVSSGRQYRFDVVPGRRFRAEQSPAGWRIETPEHTDRVWLHRRLWQCIAASEYCEMVALIDAINNDTFRATVRDVRLRFAQSKWGSCSGTGTIMLNAALLFVPRDCLHYVIVHELAHIDHPNHSDRFWSSVNAMMPGYEAARDELKGYRLPKL